MYNDFSTDYEQLQQLREEYPFVQDPDYCRLFPGHPIDDRFAAYDHYCSTLLNILERLWIASNGDYHTINNYINFKKWVLPHHPWWQFEKNKKLHPGTPSNLENYDTQFVAFINGCFKQDPLMN